MADSHISFVLVFSLLLTMGLTDGQTTGKSVKKYKPVVIIHGVNEQPSTLEFLQNYIRKAHPGTDVNLIHILHGPGSFLPMWYQVKRFREIVKNITDESEDGIHIIGYSQGGLVARGIVSTLSNHRIDTFISLAAPQLGQYGATDKKHIRFYEWIIQHLYIILYSFLGQLSSLGGYWKDPHHIDSYKKNNFFLPILNNVVHTDYSEDASKETFNIGSMTKRGEEGEGGRCPRNFSAVKKSMKTMNSAFQKAIKANMLQLKRFILIGTRNDTTITPWQSSQFGFYNESGDIVEMKQQEVYTNDLFGLKTLDNRGSLVILTAQDLDHQDLPYNVTFLEKYLLPWLT